MTCKLSLVFLLLSIFWLHTAQIGATTERYFGKRNVILNPTTQLVLDGSQRILKARRSTNSSAQSWYIKDADNGAFYFVNEKTNKVLSMPNEWTSWNNAIVTTDLNHIRDKYQQWYVNPDGTIANAGDTELALEINLYDTVELTPRGTIGVYYRQVFKIISY